MAITNSIDHVKKWGTNKSSSATQLIRNTQEINNKKRSSIFLIANINKGKIRSANIKIKRIFISNKLGVIKHSND